MISPRPEVYFQLVERLTSIAVLISSLELLSLWREFLPGGIYRREFVAGGDGHSSSEPAKKSFALQVFLFCNGLRLILASLILAGLANGYREPVLLALTFLLSLAIGLQMPFGLEGAEQMMLIVLASLTIGSLPQGADRLRIVALWFICLQACLAYVTAGVAKARKPAWRDGTFLASLLQTTAYSRPFLSKLKLNERRLRPLSVAIILFESLFVLALSGPMIALPFLFVGVVFHLFNAVVSGLNIFLWVFVATYPAVWYCAGGLL